MFVFLLLLMLFYVTLESLSAAWLSYIFEARYRLSAREAAVALMLFWAGMLVGRFYIVFLPARWTLWPSLAISSLGIVAAGLILALVDLQVVRYAGVLLMGAACGPMWPVIVMTTSVTCRSERRTSVVIGLGAIGFASGPLLGSLLLKAGLEAQFFSFELGLGALVLALFLLAAASRRVMEKQKGGFSSGACARCPGTRRR